MRLTPAIVVAFTACAWAPVSSAAATAHQTQRKVVIVVADTATWQDYTSSAAPFVRGWLRECAVGLMNTRVATVPTPPSAYLTLGAASRVSARLDPDLADLALNYDEPYEGGPAHQVYYARTGRALPPGALAYFGLPSVSSENADALYGLRLGLLGQALADAGLKAAAIGNADVPGAYRRQVVTIVMDEAGVVPLGDIGPGMHRAAPEHAPPLITDYRAVLAELRRTLPHAAVAAIETGDLARIAERRDVITPARLLEERAAAVSRLDAFMRELVGMMRDRPWRLYLVTPSALAELDERSDVLTPIVAWGRGIQPGLLTSPATRRTGIVANTDLAPSVLHFMDLPVPAEAIGRPMSVQPLRGAAVAYITRVQHAQEQVEISRPYLLDRASAFVISVFVLAAVMLILSGPAPRSLTAALRGAALVVMALPLAALLMPADIHTGPGVILLSVVALIAVLYAGARSLGRFAPPYAWLAGAFALVLCADTATGQHLVQASLLSYSVTVGSRYYGLGNELGGALLAAAPLALGVWLGTTRARPAKRLGAALALAAVVVIIGYPTMGANIGIAVPAAVGSGLMMLGLYSPRPGLRQMAVAAGIVLAAVGVIAAANLLIGGEGLSHIGLAVRAVGHGHFVEVAQAFSRRFARNLLLVRYSSATWVLVSALVVLLGTAMGRNRALSERIDATSALGPALTGAGVASALSFFLNDSGVASAAWGFSLIAAATMYIAFDWRLSQGGPRA